MARKTRETERRAMAVNLTNFGVLRISVIVVAVGDDDAVAVVAVVMIIGGVGFILFVFGSLFSLSLSLFLGKVMEKEMRF